MKPVSALLLVSLIALPFTNAAEIRCFAPANGAFRCVVVGAAPLAHTGQIMGGGGPLQDQIQATLANVNAALLTGGSSLAQAVKLNVYVTRDSVTPEIEAELAAVFPGSHKPAVSFVTTALPGLKTLIAMDAIGVAASVSVGGQLCSVLPVGPRVYISGQAEKGDGTLADATRQTMASLGRTLEFLGLEKKNVVQLKSFLTPMAQRAEAENEIAAFFKDLKVPPCAFVEWQSTLPIEIEMIVSGAGNASLVPGPSVEVRTPPGMTAPAVYSRLTITRHPTTIYTGGLYPSNNRESAEAQLRSIFTNLKQALDVSGSDWMHLVKATYYVSNGDLNTWHNNVRPDYFSPRRPPAASKAVVSGTGQSGHGITMDFIVVPGEP